MAHVSNFSSKKYRKMCLPEDEAPDHVDKEGEKIIKELVQKQTSKNISLTEQLQLQQNFTSPSQVTTLSKFTAGKSSLRQFSAEANLLDFEEKLRRHGFSNEEITMALDLQKGEEFYKSKHKIMENSVAAARLATLQSKIKAAFNNAPIDIPLGNIGRHERDLLQSVQAQSINSKVVQIMHSKQSVVETIHYPADHPMNKLVELDKELFGHLKHTSIREHRKKKRRRTQLPNDSTKVINSNLQSEELQECALTTTTSAFGISHGQEGSLWDLKHVPATVPVAVRKPKSTTETRVYTCAPQKWYMVKDKKIHDLGRKLPAMDPPKKEIKQTGAAFVVPIVSDLLPLEKIQSQRLPLSEIIKMPRFAEYKPGIPSKTLFIKNLSKSLTEADLSKIFGHFEDPNLDNPRLIYRLMGGKMKGQAFITFSSVELAKTAMESINGYQFDGKPIIIQFGKKLIGNRETDVSLHYKARIQSNSYSLHGERLFL